MKINALSRGGQFLSIALLLFFAALDCSAQTEKTVSELNKEVDNYVRNKTKEAVANGKKVDAAGREKFEREKQKLAEKYAASAALRTNLSGADYYYLSSLYEFAEDYPKALEAINRYNLQLPPDAKGNLVQSARSWQVILNARTKKFVEMEAAFNEWTKGEIAPGQKETLQNAMAAALYRAGEYDKAIKYAAEAFAQIKKSFGKTTIETNKKTEIYGSLVEVLSASYRKAKRNDDAVAVLAEGRALSFTIPSAELYRKVMDLVKGFNVSEKKLMEKVESYKTADAAPELAVQEWLGQEPATLEKMRGKIVLLDFWATWCLPCISTFPRLRSWHKKFSDQGFVIVGVTRYWGKEGARTMTPLQEFDFLGEFKQKYKLPYGFAISKGSASMTKYGVGAYPTTFLLDRNGIVRYIGIGAGSEESENLENMIEKVLKEQ